MEHSKTTPRDFFLWAGAMVTLYGSIVAFITLLFGYIDYVFPDVLNTYYQNPYDSGISYSMASFIIFGAAAVALLRVIHGTIAHDSSRGEVWVRKWALYLTLFIAGISILVDLITVLNTFLSGDELSVRFLLKVAIVLLVASGVFMHFLADLRGYWVKERAKANAITAAVALVGILTIAAGFFIIGSPWQARQYRLDDQRVNDLQSIQSEVTNFYQNKRVLPTSLAQLNDPLLYFSVPVDPVTGASYEYVKTADLGFQLCATFSMESIAQATTRTMPVMVGGKEVADSWYHGKGRTCFTRSIDPDFYPPLKNGVPAAAVN